ncbi:MAG: glycosyltransferase family 2 protein [Pseudomonadota bacterium]
MTYKTLTVIMAAYNEVKTIRAVINNILKKKIDSIEIDLIIVESNSSDGTKEIVQEYENHPKVRIIWQPEAHGKGYAIRSAFSFIKSDYILIQDADDEYDVDDYDALLAPLIAKKTEFVLGAREGDFWSIRKFPNQPFLTLFMNFGHVFFAFLINKTLKLKLKDPFTMYKVFGAHCIKNLTFECNRFDFDHELVIKLVKNGYIPIEIPVKYRSRSFKEGKKINIIRDPLTWLIVIIRLTLN